MTSNITLILAIIAMAAALAACTNAQRQDTAIIAGNIAGLQAAYDDAAAVYDAHIDQVPASQRKRVASAWSTITQLHSRIADVSPRKLLTDAELSGQVYDMAKQAYMQLRPVANELIAQGDIGPEQAARLREIDRRAQRLDDAIERLSSSASTGQVELLRTARDLLPLVRLIVSAAA